MEHGKLLLESHVEVLISLLIFKDVFLILLLGVKITLQNKVVSRQRRKSNLKEL